ncbi:MAG: (2Fe-2S)-binding protein [Halapricum sp.]
MARSTDTGRRNRPVRTRVHPQEGPLVEEIDLTINGTQTTIEADEEEDLATALRAAGYKGVKCGCNGGVCGASKVIIDDEARMACGMTATDAADSHVETIEGLGTQDDLHPIQQAFVDHFAVQCGFCIPGMIMEAKDLLSKNPDPSEREVREAIDDNVCRCTGYQKPVEAILDAAERLRDEPSVAADGGEAISNAADGSETIPNGGDRP